jgi:hypothetical protein
MRARKPFVLQSDHSRQHIIKERKIMKEKKQQKKVEYVKPQILDLGPVTPTVGGTCTTDGGLPTGKTDCAGTGSWVSHCILQGSTAGLPY